MHQAALLGKIKKLCIKLFTNLNVLYGSLQSCVCLGEGLKDAPSYGWQLDPESGV